MRIRSITTIAITGLFALSGCSGSTSSDSGQLETDDAQTQSSEAAEETSNEQTPTDDPEGSTLTLDTGEKTVTIEPTAVYCSGKPGSLHHIIGKTNDELPLVKAEGTDFVMAKVGQGRPFTANSPTGVDIGDESVTFEGTELGSAVLDGTMTCTDWED